MRKMGCLMALTLLVSTGAWAQDMAPGDAKPGGGGGSVQTATAPAETKAEQTKAEQTKAAPAPAGDSAAKPETGTESDQAERTEDSYRTVVTASRAEERELVAGRAIELVTADEIARIQPRSIPEALSEATGAWIQMTNRGAGSPMLRGLIGPQNLILVDGIRYNMTTFRTGPNQYLAMVDPWLLKGIEVVRGPGSVLYGSDAMGGVFHLLTRDGLGEGLHGTIQGRYSSVDSTKAGHGFVSYGTKTSGVLLGGGYQLFDLLEAGGGEEQPGTDYSQGSWMVKGHHDLSDRLEVRAAYVASRTRDAGRTDRLNKGDFRRYDNDDDFVYLGLVHEGSGPSRRTTATVSFHRLREHVLRHRCKSDDTGYVSDLQGCVDGDEAALDERRIKDDEVITPGFSVVHEMHLLDHALRLTTGAEAYFDEVLTSTYEKGKADDGFAMKEQDRGNYSEGSTYLSSGAFLHGEYDLLSTGPHTVTGFGGVRLSYFSAHADDVPGVGNVDLSFTGLVGSAGLKYLFSDTATVYGTWSQGFRAPNLEEATVLGSVGSVFMVPNDDLGPERSDTLEFGVRTRVAGKLALQGAVFKSWIEDKLTREPATWEGKSELEDGLPVRRYTNADSGETKGVEGAMAVGPFSGVTLSGNLAYMEGDVTRDEDGSTEPARRIPPLFGKVALTYSTGGYYAEFFTRFAGPQDRLAPDDLEDMRICEDPEHPGNLYPEGKCPGTEGWHTFNLRAGATIMESYEAELALLNLTDEKYRIHGSGLLAPGFEAALRLRGSF